VKDRLLQVLRVNEKESLPAMKQTSSGLGDGFDESPQVMENRDGIFDKSNVGQDKGKLKLRVQDSACRAELSW
jgi:hypothetical protein